MNFFKSHSKTNAFVAGLVFFISFIVYFRTMAPSICLWDCGEYLASTACLGLPHPPGTPLLIMMARTWVVLLSFIKDMGFRFNLIAVCSSATTVFFIYLIIVRSMIFIMGEPDLLWKRLSIYCAGFMGGLFCAFGGTFWYAALEASQQSNITNITVVLTIWLALVWAQSKSENRDRLLILISYVAFAGVGIRMISMITMPAVLAFIMILDQAKRKEWQFWGASIALSLVLYNLSYFLVIVPVVCAICFIMVLVSRRGRKKWSFCFWFTFVALIGFTNHAYLPIRSSLNPAIDEGHPVTMAALKEVLDRKQYGSESMATRSFWRRGSFSHQFGIEGHMGYGGFHMLQFFHFSTRDQEKNFVDGTPAGYLKLLIYLIPTFFMFLGWYLLIKRDKRASVLLITVTVLTTFGMIWYMNFSDGTKVDSRREYEQWERSNKQGPMPVIYREVRVRDYFYSSGFMFFSMWMGLSAGLLLFRFFNGEKTWMRRLAPGALVAFAISPALPLSQNYALRDRSNNWLPIEYAYNLLMSCEKDGILITNGDNDTFPLWAIQEAYGIRKDVRLVNLSLVNTQWYIRQLKKVEPRVPISYTESQISNLEPEFNPFEKPTPVELPNAKIPLTLPGRQQLQILRVQDKMVLNIADANKWSKPLYFACSVSPDNFMGLEPYLQMQGMVYRVWPKPVEDARRVDLDRTEVLLDKVYKLRPYQPRRIDKDEPYEGIVSDYAISFMWLGMQLRSRMESVENEITAIQKKKENEKKVSPQDSLLISAKKAEISDCLTRALKHLDRCVSLMPWNMQPVELRHQILLRSEKAAMAEERERKLLAKDPDNEKLRELLIQSLVAQGKQKEAESLYQGSSLPGRGG